MTEIFATLELTKAEVESLYFILRRVGGLGRTRMAADRVKRAIEDVHSFEPKDARAGHPFPAPYDMRNVGGGLFLYEKSPDHLLRSLRRTAK